MDERVSEFMSPRARNQGPCDTGLYIGMDAGSGAGGPGQSSSSRLLPLEGRPFHADRETPS